MGLSDQHHAPAALHRGRFPLHITQEAEWALEQVWVILRKTPCLCRGPKPRSPTPWPSYYTGYAIMVYAIKLKILD